MQSQSLRTLDTRTELSNCQGKKEIEMQQKKKITMMIGNRLLTFMLLLSLFCCSSAIRGQSRLDGRNVSEETRKGHRRAAHWGAAVKDVSVPPGVVERSHGSNSVEKGQAKKTRVDTTSEDDTFKDTREIIYNVDELAPKKAKGKKGQKGDDSLITAESDCDDPDDPRCAECDDSDDPKCQESAPTTATPEVLEQLDQEASVGDSAVGNSETSSYSSPGTLFPENYGRQFGIGSGSATGARNQSFSNGESFHLFFAML